MKSVQTTVDSFGDADEVLNVGHFIQAVQLPEEARRGECVLRRRRQIGIANQIDAQQVAVFLVIGAASDLDGAAPAVAETVAPLSVAEPSCHVARRLIFLLLRRRPPNIFHLLQLALFVSYMSQKGRRPQWGVDLVDLHNSVYEWQVKLALRLWQPRHNLLQITIGKHRLWLSFMMAKG